MADRVKYLTVRELAEKFSICCKISSLDFTLTLPGCHLLIYFHLQKHTSDQLMLAGAGMIALGTAGLVAIEICSNFNIY